MKKTVSVCLVFVLLLLCVSGSALSVSAAVSHAGSVFYIGGGPFQDLPLQERLMTDNGDGSYSYSYHMQKGETVKVFFKEIKADGCSVDYTASYGQVFRFATNTEQTVTILCKPDSDLAIEVIGEDIRAFFGNYIYIYASFAGQDQFSAEDGLMKRDENGIYSVTYRNVQPCEAIFDISVVCPRNPVGFYGYNVFPAIITAPCDVTVYYQPDYAYELEYYENSNQGSGYYENIYNDYDYIKNIYTHYSDSCKIWAEGEYLTPNSELTLGDVSFYCSQGSYPAVKVSDKEYYTVMQNVEAESKPYFAAVFDNGLTCEMFYVSEGKKPVDVFDGTELEAKLYPIWFSTDDIAVHSPYSYTNVKCTLDTTNLDYVTKEGAVFRFELFDMMRDVNMDCAVTIDDATELQRGLAELIELTDNQQLAADVNGDKTVNVKDVTALQRILAELEP